MSENHTLPYRITRTPCAGSRRGWESAYLISASVGKSLYLLLRLRVIFFGPAYLLYSSSTNQSRKIAPWFSIPPAAPEPNLPQSLKTVYSSVSRARKSNNPLPCNTMPCAERSAHPSPPTPKSPKHFSKKLNRKSPNGNSTKQPVSFSKNSTQMEKAPSIPT